MKAMVIRECGPPEVMRLEEIPTPAPGPGEVLIRVHAVSVNRTLDLAVRAGTYAFRPSLPHVLGVDPSGVIEAVRAHRTRPPAGGLGIAGIQVAKSLGARVIAAAGADARVRAALDFGADVGVNYRASDLTDEVRRATNGRGVDVVFENIADVELFPKAFASLARN